MYALSMASVSLSLSLSVVSALLIDNMVVRSSQTQTIVCTLSTEFR